MSFSGRIRHGAVNERKIGASADCSISVLSGNLVVLETIEEAQAITGGVIDSDDLLAELGNVDVREVELQGCRSSRIRYVIPDLGDVLLSDVTDRRKARDRCSSRQNRSAVS